MSRSLVEAAGSFLESRTSRRSFLTRAALAGSALTVAPVRYLLRPGTAYAAICGCANQSCDCGSACCDGYTEFCCTLTGANVCPPGTFTGGWWKADGTSFCSPDSSAPRYYIDCNLVPGTGCGCQCAGGDCNNRRTCCNVFRYGQCHQEIGEVTAIKCRVVTCTPPWQLDPACTSASLTDQSTADHDASCLHTPARPAIPRSLPAVVRGNRFYARTSLSTGPADIDAGFGNGLPGDFPVMGDWNGDGTKTPGVVRGNTWLLKNSFSGGPADIVTSFGNGLPGDFPVVGDWNGDGIDTPGVVRGNTWLLKNSFNAGAADFAFSFGNGFAAGDFPVVGDWNGNGFDTAGVVRGNIWYLKNSLSGGAADIVFAFGNGTPGDFPVVGDWTGSGIDSAGVVRSGLWLLKSTLGGGAADISFWFGNAGDRPLRWAQR